MEYLTKISKKVSIESREIYKSKKVNWVLIGFAVGMIGLLIGAIL